MNEDRNITLKQDPATGEPAARRLKRLADELAELLVDDQKGQVFLQIYPAGHEKGVVLRAIASPNLTIPVSEFRGSSRPGLADFREVAENLRDLEDDVHDLARSVSVIDEHINLIFDRARRDDADEVIHRIDLETVRNIQFLSADTRRRAAYLRDCFDDAAVYPFTADGAQAAEVNGEVRP
ncbi:hypothetical protein [Ciceribacter sp. RN22]|uniref:hypothetical protein n=1 Tax=Ciceribacter sp. RN22 TaxID=2954932 RepID=UPI002093511B|nr:hypothetical protein [Ciceribacter sp. RN22]MCO6180268.1 hypothetical protein [Ciceribacter sp. RN22]